MCGEPGGDDGEDRYQEYKDDLAMGYINPDGSQREGPCEPPEEYLEREAEEQAARHSRDAHDGGPCTCLRDPGQFSDDPPF
jgi:hypothetical protein